MTTCHINQLFQLRLIWKGLWACFSWDFLNRPPEYLCASLLVSAGLPGEECKPGEGGGGQAEGEVSQPGPETWRLRLPHEETTERGRWPRLVGLHLVIKCPKNTAQNQSVYYHVRHRKASNIQIFRRFPPQKSTKWLFNIPLFKINRCRLIFCSLRNRWSSRNKKI